MRSSIFFNLRIGNGSRFLRSELAAELVENLPAGTYVEHAEVRSSSSCTFEIVSGNDGDVFLMNPSTGVVTTKRPLDYEATSFYNLTVQATNMVRSNNNANIS